MSDSKKRWYTVRRAFKTTILQDINVWASSPDEAAEHAMSDNDGLGNEVDWEGAEEAHGSGPTFIDEIFDGADACDPVTPDVGVRFSPMYSEDAELHAARSALEETLRCVAAFAVEREGQYTVPELAALQRLNAHPEIAQTTVYFRALNEARAAALPRKRYL